MRFGRNRFLALLGGSLTAFAVRLVTAKSAVAGHSGIFSPGCYGYWQCHCCRLSGTRTPVCCEPGCVPRASCLPNLVGSDGQELGQCWVTCLQTAPGGELFMCCDYTEGAGLGGPCSCGFKIASGCNLA